LGLKNKMNDKKNKLNEMNTSSSSQGVGGSPFRERKVRKNSKRAGQPFTVAEKKSVHKDAFTSTKTAMVIKPKSKSERSKGKDIKNNPNATLAQFETKSERTLRESIKNLIYLNRIKYHEEQAKREMNEQKLRKVIRYLLTEADEANKINYSSTGETAAAAFIKKISVTFDEYASLKSTQAQREEFKKIYLTGIKIYLDALDQQYYILNPEERQPNVAAPALPPAQPAGPEATTPNMSEPAARRGDRKINEAAPSPINSTEVNPLSGINTKAMRAQATTAAVQAVGASDKTGHGTAENALNRDLPQIDPLYINLTFKTFSANNANGSTRTTSDRKDFRMMLIGDTATNTAGNIANEFNKIDVSNQTNDSPHKGDASQTPPLTPQPLPTGEPAAPVAPAPTPSAEPSAGPDLAGGETELPV